MATEQILITCPWCVAGKTEDGRYCENCNGTTQVVRGSVHEACHHDYQPRETVGRCLTLYRCATCHHEVTIDSS